MPLVSAWISLLATLLGPASDPGCYALGGLDVARAEALANVNVSDLLAVYVDAAAAARDQRLLELYAARGLRIVGAGMIRDECRVVARSAERVELDVTERLAPAWAISESGEMRRLPRDGLTRRQVVLSGGPGRWRIASVR